MRCRLSASLSRSRSPPPKHARSPVPKITAWGGVPQQSHRRQQQQQQQQPQQPRFQSGQGGWREAHTQQAPQHPQQPAAVPTQVNSRRLHAATSPQGLY